MSVHDLKCHVTQSSIALNDGDLALPAGITSPASINYKDEDTIISQMTEKGLSVDQAYVEHVLPEKMRYNLAYLREFSFLGDIKIMFQTVFEVLK